MRYSYARLGGIDTGIFRLGGTGLGNLLFPWARFIVATHKHGLVPIYPTWFQIKLGPLLRNERDKRFYLDLFRPPAGHIHGFRKLLLLSALEKVQESDLERLKAQPDFIVAFKGMAGHFQPILKDHVLVLTELLNMIRDKHIKNLTESLRKSIGVHVRRGDFTPLKGELPAPAAVNCQIPLSWYISQIEQLRQVVGPQTSVNVFSDGSSEELSELLALKNIRRVNFGSSVADLLALSRSGILVASGSTFSMWASYLGRMPVIWHAGQLKQKLYYDFEGFETESDTNGKLPPLFLDLLEKRFSHLQTQEKHLSFH